jgi:hypothetical protein
MQALDVLVGFGCRDWFAVAIIDSKDVRHDRGPLFSRVVNEDRDPDGLKEPDQSGTKQDRETQPQSEIRNRGMVEAFSLVRR